METFFSAHEIIDMAVTTEETGYEFYKLAEKNARSDSTRQLFAYLADEEINHKHIFKGLKDSIEENPQGVPVDWEDVGKYIRAMVDSSIFMGKDKNINLASESQDDKETIDFALGFEKDTLLFFYQLKDMIKSGAKDIIQKIINEEKEHIRRLTEMKKLV